MTRIDFSCLLIFVFTACSVMGQAKQKKLLTPADYHLWSNLEISDISNKGKWVSYGLRYASEKDTLFVKRSDGKKTYFFPQGRKGKFCGESWFATQQGNGDLMLTNLASGKQTTFEGVSDYEFSANEKFLFVLTNIKDGFHQIIIRDLTTGQDTYVDEVRIWRFNKLKNRLAYCLKSGEAYVAVVEKTVTVVNEIELPGNSASTIIWADDGSALLLATQTLDNAGQPNLRKNGLSFFRFKGQQLLHLSTDNTPGLSEGYHIEALDSGTLKISKDGKRVFFTEAPDLVINPYLNPVVEVWQGDDRLLYSERQQYEPFEYWPKTVVWYPDTGSVFEFMTHETHVKLSGDQKYALTSSFEPCALQFRYMPDRDYYITNLETKTRKLWKACHSPELYHTLLSPYGKYIAYYQDGHWFTYDYATETHKNLTNGLGVAFFDEDNDIGDKPDAYGFAGWTASDESIVVQDRYDIWVIKCDGSEAKRLTRGREQNIVYRFTDTTRKAEPFNGVYLGTVIDLQSGIVLKMQSPNENMQGYSVWKNGKVTSLAFGAHRIHDLKKADNDDVSVFIKEDYEHAPSLQWTMLGKTRTLFQSNPQQQNYLWGIVKTIQYIGATGKTLQGLLYYPTEYRRGRMYPMVVKIYQTQSDRLHWYRNPRSLVFDGFSIPTLVSQGYFVLMPDIDYVMGNPGGSAVTCATAAVNSALANGDIDAKRIGLIGHSFGGYESAYIIANTDLFCTAVAGAAFTDLVSEYLTISKNYKKAEIWRYEYYTNRMITPLFENLEGYMNNSVVFKTPNIKTPLLLWTGEDDPHIASSQATELYLAMRRLGKKVTMLRYPQEGHNLENPLSQQDLQSKVLEWFDYYLKGAPSKDWMTVKH